MIFEYILGGSGGLKRVYDLGRSFSLVLSRYCREVIIVFMGYRVLGVLGFSWRSGIVITDIERV